MDLTLDDHTGSESEKKPDLDPNSTRFWKPGPDSTLLYEPDQDPTNTSGVGGYWLIDWLSCGRKLIFEID